MGEASGDLHGAGLARALRRRLPGVRLIGLGGPRMAAEGVELLAGIEDLAVMGIAEVLARLPYFVRLRRRVFDALDRERVDLVIPLDYPGFNLRLARHARATGRRVLYYIAPQVWAWHTSRVRELARDTDRVAVILPFEEAFLRERGVAAEFVGHPLLDRTACTSDRERWFAEERLDRSRPVLGLMPGSRAQELKRHLRLFVEAAERVRGPRPEVQVVVGAALGVDPHAYDALPFPVTRDTAALIEHADAVLAKSGTTTLELALAGTPFVVAYRLNPLSYQIARRVVEVPHIALANLIAERRVVPEFVQGEATPAALATAVLEILHPGPSRERMVEGLGAVRRALGTGGAAARVAEIAAELLGESGA